MWSKLKKCLGYAWASPVTAVGLLYASACHAIGWYRWVGVKEDALVWQVTNKSPMWLLKLWSAWAGHAIGNVVVMNVNFVTKPKFLQHELVHVRQCMRLGVFHPIIYGITYLAIKLGCETSHPYWDQVFEIDARRAVGQPVDVTGAMKKIGAARKGQTTE